MADSNDVPMLDGHEEMSHLPISEDEAKILELYDRIQELRLEIAIINAQKSHQPGLFLSEISSQYMLTVLRENLIPYRRRNRKSPIRTDGVESAVYPEK